MHERVDPRELAPISDNGGEFQTTTEVSFGGVTATA